MYGDGRPWGDGTKMAKRAKHGREPWDVGNRVTPLIGGYAALSAIRDAFEAAIVDAERQGENGVEPGNAATSTSSTGCSTRCATCRTRTPGAVTPGADLRSRAARRPRPDRARFDRPDDGRRDQGPGAGLDADVDPGAVRRRGACPAALALGVRDPGPQHRLCGQGPLWQKADPIGVCALDLRTADVTAASLHQKMVVVRVGEVNVGFCGGVDLAYTRRDYGRPANQIIGLGDWQSGHHIPIIQTGWPLEHGSPLTGYQFAEAEQRGRLRGRTGRRGVRQRHRPARRVPALARPAPQARRPDRRHAGGAVRRAVAAARPGLQVRPLGVVRHGQPRPVHQREGVHADRPRELRRAHDPAAGRSTRALPSGTRSSSCGGPSRSTPADRTARPSAAASSP